MKIAYTILALIILPIIGYFVALHNNEVHPVWMAFFYGYVAPVVALVAVFIMSQGGSK